MHQCPVCLQVNEDPAGDAQEIECPSCYAKYVWPLPQQEEAIDVLAIDPSEVVSMFGQIISALDPNTKNELLNMIVAGTETPSLPPRTISLSGNNKVHQTLNEAKRVTVKVIAPTSGPVEARPTVDDVPLLGGAGDYIFESPGHSMTILTNAGNNEVVIVEEY